MLQVAPLPVLEASPGGGGGAGGGGTGRPWTRGRVINCKYGSRILYVDSKEDEDEEDEISEEEDEDEDEMEVEDEAVATTRTPKSGPVPSTPSYTWCNCGEGESSAPHQPLFPAADQGPPAPKLGEKGASKQQSAGKKG